MPQKKGAEQKVALLAMAQQFESRTSPTVSPNVSDDEDEVMEEQQVEQQNDVFFGDEEELCAFNI